MVSLNQANWTKMNQVVSICLHWYKFVLWFRFVLLLPALMANVRFMVEFYLNPEHLLWSLTTCLLLRLFIHVSVWMCNYQQLMAYTSGHSGKLCTHRVSLVEVGHLSGFQLPELSTSYWRVWVEEEVGFSYMYIRKDPPVIPHCTDR